MRDLLDGLWTYWGKMSQFENITGASGSHAFQPESAVAQYNEEVDENDAEEEPAGAHGSLPPTMVPSSHPLPSSTSSVSTLSPATDDVMDVDKAVDNITVSQPVSSGLSTCLSLAVILSETTTETSITSSGGTKQKFSALGGDDRTTKPKSTRGRGPSHRDLLANQLTGSLNGLGDVWRSINVQKKAEEEAEDHWQKEEWARENAQMAEKHRLELEGSPLAQRIFRNKEALLVDLVLDVAQFFSTPENSSKANFYMAAPSTAMRRAYILKELCGAGVDIDHILAQDSGPSI
jgi:hypothetical protein